jgi:hypothetical protein
MSRTSACVIVLAFSLIACSAGTDPGTHTGGHRDAGVPGFDSGLPPGFDSGPRRDAFVPCEGSSVVAMSTFAPVDIIWVIDSSGSMDGEARIVQDNMNNFAASISGSGIDYHVVVITDPSFVTVPPPLGTDPMRYLFVNHPVGSNEPLQALISTYPMYQMFLRPMAVTHFVIVTDDESDLAAGAFQTMMEGLLGHTFDAHAIASPNETHPSCPFPLCPTEPGCTGPNGDAADVGMQYMTLTDATGGRFFSICTADWSALFADLEAAIAIGTTIPCVFIIPPPPEGMAFDERQVNVRYTPGGGGDASTVGKVHDSTACGPAGGWYYDSDETTAPDAPAQILLCPASCDTIGRDTMGSIDIAFGCATIPI